MFSVAQADILLSCAKDHGYKLKMHINQINDIGGIDLALKHKVVSVDHMDNASGATVARLYDPGITAVLLPNASYFLNLANLPAVESLISNDIPIAIETNFNPGSSPSCN